MSYLALYRKYRPVDFKDVYGQDEIVTIIKNAIATNKLSHAYLFCGPRGTGKTTIAKILARTVNCENLTDSNACGKCHNCINYLSSNDIVEIDAASNNGVDEIREIKNKINLVPTNSKYKVYIIDEVHMLTIQAFNALLKTLEEPPSHAIFILATTEPHKIPLTISSRCQKFKFTKININSIVDRLKDICNLENISINDDAIYEIAKICDGGMRDAINLLDQVAAYTNNTITLDDVYKVNGSISYNELYKLLEFIKLNNKNEIIKFFDVFDTSGKEINKFVENFILFIKDVIIYNNTSNLTDIEVENNNILLVNKLLDNNTLYDFIEMLNDLQSKLKISTHGSVLLMISLLKFSDQKFNISDDTVIAIEKHVDDKKIIVESNNKNISREININPNVNKNDNSNIEIIINNAFALASKTILQEIKDKWKIIDDYICDNDYSLAAGVLKDSDVVVGSEKYIIVTGKNDSIVERINDNIDSVEKFINNILNYNVKIAAITDIKWQEEKNKYIKNIKSGIKYTEKNMIEEMNNIKTPVDELIDLMGSNIIEYKEGE